MLSGDTSKAVFYMISSVVTASSVITAIGAFVVKFLITESLNKKLKCYVEFNVWTQSVNGLHETLRDLKKDIRELREFVTGGNKKK